MAAIPDNLPSQDAAPVCALASLLCVLVPRHTPAKMTLRVTPSTAMQFAALLLFVHGKAESPYDWSLRPFLLEFVTEDRSAREAPHRELRERIGAGGLSTSL